VGTRLEHPGVGAPDDLLTSLICLRHSLPVPRVETTSDATSTSIRLGSIG
jgi:hypothetical protein